MEAVADDSLVNLAKSEPRNIIEAWAAQRMGVATVATVTPLYDSKSQQVWC